MLISADARVYLLSRKKKFNKTFPKFAELIEDRFFLNEGIAGPQNFLSDLLLSIEANKLANTTPNVFISDFHLLNAGFYSRIWKHFSLKSRRHVLLRLDGIGIDFDDPLGKKKEEKNILNLIDKSSHLIYQSKFQRDCFNNIFRSCLWRSNY